MTPHRRVRRIMRYLANPGAHKWSKLYNAELIWLCADWWTATTSPTVMARDELRKMAEWCQEQARERHAGPWAIAAAFKMAAMEAEERAKELEDGHG